MMENRNLARNVEYFCYKFFKTWFYKRFFFYLLDIFIGHHKIMFAVSIWVRGSTFVRIKKTVHVHRSVNWTEKIDQIVVLVLQYLRPLQEYLGRNPKNSLFA